MKKNGKHRFYRNKFAINFGRLEIFASYQGRYMYMCVYIYIYICKLNALSKWIMK